MLFWLTLGLPPCQEGDPDEAVSCIEFWLVCTFCSKRLRQRVQKTGPIFFALMELVNKPSVRGPTNPGTFYIAPSPRPYGGGLGRCGPAQVNE